MFRRVLKTVMALILFAIVFAFFCNLWIVLSTSSRIYDDVDSTPVMDVALVLGTSPWTRSGELSDHYRSRIEAAAALYDEGKIKHILASGANPDNTYNEPRKMYQALVKLGVPGEAITLDFAGFRTLDSVVRARKVFGQKRLIIVSQRFHDYRAIFLADKNDIEAIAFAAQKDLVQTSVRNQGREFFARVRAILDLYVLRTGPRFLGPAEPLVIRPESSLGEIQSPEPAQDPASASLEAETETSEQPSVPEKE